MLVMIASIALLVLAGWAGITAARLALWRGLVVAALPLIGIGIASATGKDMLAYLALLPLAYFAYQNRGSEFDITAPVVGLFIAIWLWGYANEHARLANASAYEAKVAAFQQQNEANAVNIAAVLAQWPTRVAKLKQHRGKLALADTGAELVVPAHWRFIEAAGLREALSGSEYFPGLGVLGWLVHERVDIAKLDTIWYIEVYAEQLGHVSAKGVDDSDLEARKAEATSQLSKQALDAGKASFSFRKFAEAPRFDPLYERAVWVNQMSYPGATELLLDCYSIKLGKEAQIWFRMREQFEGSRELCVRSVRLMAARTQFGSDATYADYTWLLDDSSGFDLGEVIADEHRVDD
jgi:hypothetical protein